MDDLFYDIIIVGGGPAGSSCGLFLKKEAPALKVCIIDKQRFPRNKPCGDGISPGVVDLMHEAGLQHAFSAKYPISIFELSCGEALRIRYDMRQLSHARSYGYVYDRKTLDNVLFQQAATSGVTVFENHEISTITETADGHTQLTCRHAGGTTRFTGRIIVGADGAYSKIRSYLNIPSNSDTHKGVSLRYYCTTQLSELTLRIDILKNLGNSYGWVFPLSPTMANVGIGVDADVYKQKKLNLNHELQAYLQRLQATIPLEIIPGTRAGFPLPYGDSLPPLFQDNKVLIGDAASMINPLTGEGIYYAMYSGKLLANHLAQSYYSNRSLSEALPKFATDFQQQFRQHYQINLKLKKLLTSPFSSLFLKILQKDPVLLHKVMHIVMGNAATLDVRYLPLKMLKKSTRFAYEQFKNKLQKRSAGL
jgi:menaquinone-9 beta-reductase